MMRWFYSLVFYLSLPLVVVRLLWRARSAPAYARRWGERFGFFAARPGNRPAIWLHAVSVGETLAALPLIKQLQLRYPQHDLIVTTTTPTGSERVKAAFGETVFHVYAPYDLPDCLGRFLRRARPQLAVIMETELWPNTIAACHKRQIPVVIANARLSEKSARGYGRFAALATPMLQQVSMVAAQAQADGQRFVNLGVPSDKLSVTGNIKFDLTLDATVRAQAQAIRQRWQGTGQASNSARPILLAASTHQGEDALLLQAFATLLPEHPSLLLVLVPRHPERFERVAAEASRNYRLQKHSEGGAVAADTQVVVGDTMGELLALLGASDLVFMGGTWVPNGGHNLIEPAAWAKPVFCGPSLFNFAEVSRLLKEAGGLQVVETPADLALAVAQALSSPERSERMGQAAQQVADANRGALERLLGVIDHQLM
ncbi:3-deoxy-D-manno-octulosonic acid transferase [Aestuariicella hydrocarbonica]|uniref:3-deoxy-D-manno-octulosonic acid transferase n=1 Tax=Pseudomaricurvus hydrocarbonicus TaxID=1470433 RepID=A0A9E5JX46_9GAMM|nr:lipid IV(A) 3-deoxy-D-manno-octulosonic acid transferase [Aestuariicella hydrocarbonica]NHO66535.1 3-deoxy-D-manno-octulosonic acid transferase [Aestuariicella hydrocarbonica]